MGDKPKLVVMLSRFPYPLEKGDKLRAYYQIKELSADFDITLITISDIPIDTKTKNMLTPFCAAIHIFRISKWSIFWNLFVCIFTKQPYQVGYFYSYRNHLKIKQLLQNTKPNHIYCQLLRVSEYVKDYHACSKTLDYMDAFSKGIERRESKAPWYSKWIFKSEANRLKLYERRIFDYFENKTIISEQDRDLIHHPQKNKIVCVANGIDQRFFEELTIQNEFDLVFIGNLSYAPNIEAVEYIANEILPSNPALTCLIAGASPHPSVQRMCKSNNRITLQGWTEDIRTAYCKGKIFIAPMLIGTGMQNKLLEAMALGIPCITTSLANNAIKAIDGKSILVANTQKEFSEAISALLSDTEQYKKIAREGRQFVQANFGWTTSTLPLKELIQSELRNN